MPHDEQILEVTPYKKATVWQLTSHLTNYPSKLNRTVKVTYLGIRSEHKRVWLVEQKPIWLPRAYLTRGDLEPARGNLHVCKFLRDLTNIQLRTVTAEQGGFVLSALPDKRVTTQRRKEGKKEGRREPEGERERRQEGEQGRKQERRNS